MKKVLVIITAAAMLFSFGACGKAGKNTGDDVIIRVAGLKGPTSMGMVKLMDDAAAGKSSNKMEFTIAGSADEITPKLIQGNLDIAALPVNLASVLYNKSEGEIELLAVNTLGVLYIVATEGVDIASLSDLAGKTVYATGKGSTPEYNLRYLLTQSGLDPDAGLNIEFKSEPTEVVSLLKTGGGVAMLPQPYVTVAMSSVDGLYTALDLGSEWDAFGSGSMVTGCLAVRRSFADEHPSAVKSFLEEYAKSAEYVNDKPDEAAELIEKYDIVKAAVAKKAIPACNICCLTGEEMKKAAEGYLGVLFGFNPQAVGGKLPEKDFYRAD